MKIILDTNFLMSQFIYKIDIFEKMKELVSGKHNFMVPSSVLNELNTIASKRSKYALYASAALKLIEDKIKKGEVLIIKMKGPTDRWIVDFAKKEMERERKLERSELGELIVATNDKELRKNLKKIGIKTISVLIGKKSLYFYFLLIFVVGVDALIKSYLV